MGVDRRVVSGESVCHQHTHHAEGLPGLQLSAANNLKTWEELDKESRCRMHYTGATFQASSGTCGEFLRAVEWDWTRNHTAIVRIQVEVDCSTSSASGQVCTVTGKLQNFTQSLLKPRYVGVKGCLKGRGVPLSETQVQSRWHWQAHPGSRSQGASSYDFKLVFDCIKETT
jgi:hypothetical protein